MNPITNSQLNPNYQHVNSPQKMGKAILGFLVSSPKLPPFLLLPGNNSSINLTFDQALDKWTSWMERKLLKWTEIIFCVWDYVPHSLLADIIGNFFVQDSGWLLFISISLHLMVKIIRPLKSPFWNAKVQIHFLHEKTKTEVNQLTQVHEAIWPLAQEETVKTSGDLTHKTQNFRAGRELTDQTMHF